MKPSLVRNFVERLRKARFFSISLAIHMVLGITLGGVVLFKAAQDSTAFEVGNVGFLSAEQQEASENDESLEFEDSLPISEPNPAVDTAEAGGSVSEASAIQALTNSASFEMRASAPTQQMGNSFAGARGDLPHGTGSGVGSGSGTRRLKSGLFGSTEISDGLVGYFYDLKQSSRGKPTEITDGKSYLSFCAKFATRWDPGMLKPFFKAEKALSTYQIFIPIMAASAAPDAFGATVEPTRWLVHYQGTVTAPVSGKFRFAGQGDNVLVVRFAKKVVLDAGLEPLLDNVEREPIGSTPDPQKRPMVAGEWFTVTAGTTYPIEIILGEYGGLFASYLMIQEDGKTYPLRKDQVSPILPVFQAKPTDIPEYKPELTAPTVASEPFVFSKK